MQILYYSTDIQSFKTLSTLLQSIPITMISQSQGNLTLHDVITHAQVNTAPCILPDITVMIFHEFNDNQISEVIALLKQHGIVIPYKCIVTEHNQSWRFIDLFQELVKEHKYFQTYEDLKKCIREVSEYKEGDYSEASWRNYEAAFMNGYFCLQRESTQDELEAAIQTINDALAQLSKKNNIN